MKREFAVLTRTRLELVAGKLTNETTTGVVRVMARTEGYAMVRFKGAMPFVVSEAALSPTRSAA